MTSCSTFLKMCKGDIDSKTKAPVRLPQTGAKEFTMNTFIAVTIKTKTYAG